MNLLEIRKKQIEIQKKRIEIIENSMAYYFFNKAYDFQKKLWQLGTQYKFRMLMCANQIGKTEASCCELAYHLTATYPQGWEGVRFEYAINCWALGASYEQIKKVLQLKLLGVENEEKKKFSGGFIPSSKIIHSTKVAGQLRGSVKEIKITSKNKQVSTLSFMSYEQGQKVLMGPKVDFALIDEEPTDTEIYPQVAIRTINGNRGKGGYVLLSMTPENGMTELIQDFEDSEDRIILTATWDDAPHLTAERKAEMLEAIPHYQREMRSKGIPQLGSGAIYPIPDENIYSELERIPDHFARIAGIDFGWNFTAIVWLAIDRDADIIYIYDCLKLEKSLPSETALKIKSRGEWIPMAYPHDGHLPERRTGTIQKQPFIDNGVNMLSDIATDAQGSTSVEAGIMRIWERMRSGRLKVASHLKVFFEEKRLYRRDNLGRIVKKNDHVLDATRYAEMCLRFAKTKSEASKKNEDSFNWYENSQQSVILEAL